MTWPALQLRGSWQEAAELLQLETRAASASAACSSPPAALSSSEVVVSEPEGAAEMTAGREVRSTIDDPTLGILLR